MTLLRSARLAICIMRGVIRQALCCQRFLFVGALLWMGVSGLSHAQALPPTVAQALKAAGIPLSAVSVRVEALDHARSKPLSLNAGLAMNPASTMKLLTTAAALELLGPAYRWKTTVYLNAPLRDEVLNGDVLIKGQGDPKLDYEAYWMLLRELRLRGLRDIRGDLVIDRSAFADTESDPARFDGDELRPYNVLPDAFLINYKSLRFLFSPDTAHGVARVAVQPRPPGFEITQQPRLVNEATCPDGRVFRDRLKPVFNTQPRASASFSGQYVITCGDRDVHVALLSPNDYAAGITRELWNEMGGVWTGRVREARVPTDARVFYVHESPPLAEIVRDINKFSNNVMARQLFLTVGVIGTDIPAQANLSQQQIKQWLQSKSISAPELVMENGAGLSRIERISANTLTQLLHTAWKSPVMPEFVSSLPLVAVDGTMRKRLKNDAIAGRAHIKTGLLNDVRAMAGYALDREDRRHSVVMLINHPNAMNAQAAMDALLAWVHQGQ